MDKLSRMPKGAVAMVRRQHLQLKSLILQQGNTMSYIKFGFTVAGIDAEPLPQWVICVDFFSK